MRTSETSSGPQNDSDEYKERLAQFDKFSAPTRALLALDAGRMGSWSLNIVTGEVVADRLTAKLIGLDYAQQPWSLEDVYATIASDDLSAVQWAIQEALDGTRPYYDIEFKTKQRNPNASIKWLGARGEVTERDETGAPLRLIGVNWDATEQKLTEEKLAMLAAEMDHRVKNAFAVIQALINLGDRTTTDKEEFASTLRVQVQAMSVAHAMSARMARTTACAGTLVSVREIIETVLAPWVSEDPDPSDRVQITCDPEILIHPRKVSPLAMLLYEISTNATKYGPLAADVGSLTVKVQQLSDDDVQILWIENSNTIPKTPPPQKGFGAILLENCAMNLGGSVIQERHDKGLRLTLMMKITD